MYGDRVIFVVIIHKGSKNIETLITHTDMGLPDGGQLIILTLGTPEYRRGVCDGKKKNNGRTEALTTNHLLLLLSLGHEETLIVSENTGNIWTRINSHTQVEHRRTERQIYENH